MVETLNVLWTNSRFAIDKKIKTIADQLNVQGEISSN